MAVPQYYELLNPILQALRNLGGSAAIAELDEEVIRNAQLSDEDIAELQWPGKRETKLVYRLGWARTCLKAFGLLDNSVRGVWALTPKGVATKQVDPDEVKKALRSQQSAIRTRRSRNATEEVLLPEQAEVLLEEGWRETLLRTLQNLAPAAFERLCQRMLRESGFVKVEVTGRSGDGGIDGVGIVRIGGLLGFPVLFQCKRYTGSVSASTIRDFRGAMIGRADRGLVMTTGTFSRDARTEATRDGAPPIDLMDGEELLDKLKELGLGVQVRIVEDVQVDDVFFESI